MNSDTPFWLHRESRRFAFKEAGGSGSRRMRTKLEAFPKVGLFLGEASQAFQVQFVPKKAREANIMEVTTEVAPLTVLDGDRTRAQIRDALALKNDEHFRRACLVSAIEPGLIEITIPDKPHGRKQRYRLTTKEIRRKAKRASES